MLATFNFHNVATINGNLQAIVILIRAEIYDAETLHLAMFGPPRVHARDHFDEWIQDHFARMAYRTRAWATRVINNLDLAADGNSPIEQQIRALLPQLRATVSTLVINQAGFYPP